MNRWIRPLAAVLSAVTLCGALHAAPQDRSWVSGEPVGEVPRYTLRPLCNTGPAPQLQAKVHNVYVELRWPAVAGATTYWINRSVPARNLPGTVMSTQTSATEFWDAVPDTRDAYQYTVTAVQANGCTGSTSVPVSGPFPTPNPLATGTHPSPTQVVITWDEQFGATSYRIDGPGLPNTGFYVEGTKFEPGKKPPMIGVPSGPGSTLYRLSATLAGQGVQGAWYTIVALYPEAADYANRQKIWVPRVKPIITGISPGSGTLNKTVVTITGQYLSDPTDAQPPMVWFGVAKTGLDSSYRGSSWPPKSISPTAITAVANASGYVQVNVHQAAGGGFTTNHFAVSPTPFLGLNAPPPNEPPPQKLVPGVVGLSLTGAIQVLQNAGFVAAGASGPAGPTAIVLQQSPQGGAKAPVGSTVNLTTVAQAGGYSKLTLLNNTAQQRSVNVWLFDQSTGAWSGGSALGYGGSTTLNLSTGRQYFVVALDPTKCGGQNSPQNAACEYWRLPGVPGDEKGPAATFPIN